MKRKILYPVIFIIVVVLGYLNYFKEEPGITQVKSVVETKNVSYETSGYFIEAEKQFDDLKTKETAFERAKAKFKDMVLSGDNILLNSAKNLILNNHIVGKSGNEWSFFTEELSYDNLKDAITSHSGIEVINNIQNIKIKSKNLKTNSKFEFIDLDGNVEVSNKDTELFADKARYVANTKIVTLDDNGKFKTTTNDNKTITGTFKKGRYNSDKKLLELFKNFQVNYEGVTLVGNRMWYNDEMKTFVIPDNPKISLGGYNILTKEIRNPDGKNIIYIKGKISGTNGEISFIGDRGYYNTDKKKLYIIGNVEITSKNGEKIIAEKVIYDTNTKMADFIGKNKEVIYSFQDRRATAKKVVYNTEERVFYLDDGYRYEDSTYRSFGKKLNYDFKTKQGTIFNGTLLAKGKNEKAKGEKIIFNIETRDYNIDGNAEVDNGSYVFKSEKLNYLNSEGFGHLLAPFTIRNKEDGSVISGNDGKYNIKTQDFTSSEKIEYKNKAKGIKISGDDFNYNLKTEKGKVTKNIRYENQEDKISFIGDNGYFEKSKYVKIKDNLKIETPKNEIFAKMGNYNLETEIIDIPGKIDFSSKDKKSNGTLYNGKYYVEDKLLVGKTLNLLTQDKENVTSKIASYKTDTNELNLEGAVKIESNQLVLTSESIKYNLHSKQAILEKPFRAISENNFTINGNDGIINIGKETIKGNDIKIVSNKREEFISDAIEGSMKEMRFDFIGNAYGKMFEIDQKSGRIVPVVYQGDYARVYFEKDSKNYKAIRLEGRENSVITRDRDKFYSDYIEMNLIRKVLYAGKNNKVVLNNEYGTTQIKGKRFNLDSNTNIANVNGDVYIKNTNNKKEVTTLEGEESTLDNNENTIEIRNDVRVENKELILNADKIIYNKLTNKVNAFGEVKVNYKSNGVK